MRKQQRWYDSQSTTLRWGSGWTLADIVYLAANAYAGGSLLLIGSNTADSPVYHI